MHEWRGKCSRRVLTWFGARQRNRGGFRPVEVNPDPAGAQSSLQDRGYRPRDVLGRHRRFEPRAELADELVTAEPPAKNKPVSKLLEPVPRWLKQKRRSDRQQDRQLQRHPLSECNADSCADAYVGRRDQQPEDAVDERTPNHQIDVQPSGVQDANCQRYR